MWAKNFPFEKDDAQTLIKLGLNRSQAKIYLTLISFGSLNAKKIANITKIDRGEVYRQLVSLQNNSLIEKILDFPNKYKAIPLKDGAKVLLEKKNEEYIEIKQEIKTILQKQVVKRPNNEKTIISLIPSNEYCRQHVKKSMFSVKNELNWYTQIDEIPISTSDSALKEVIQKIVKNKIKWRIIAELNNPTKKIMDYIQDFKKENSNFDIRFIEANLNVTFAIWDNIALNFFIDKPPVMKNGKALTTNNEQIVKVIKDYFEIKWKSAKKTWL